MLFLSLLGCMAYNYDDTGDAEICLGSPGSTSFDVDLNWVQASPLDPTVNWWTGESLETWDWDGSIPLDWLNASSQLAEVLGQIAQAGSNPLALLTASVLI